MSKAKRAIELMDKMGEQVGKPEPEGSAVSLNNLKPMDNVTFKKGHRQEGQLASVITFDKSKNTVDLRLGSSTQVGVPVSDILLTDASAS